MDGVGGVEVDTAAGVDGTVSEISLRSVEVDEGGAEEDEKDMGNETGGSDGWLWV